jgi:cell division septation protein DedD
MEPKRRVFIYERREFALLLVIGVAVALFAFTLGVHLGKRVVSPNSVSGTLEPKTDPSVLPSVADAIPDRREVLEQQKGVTPAVEEALEKSLHEEVVKTKIRLDQPKVLDLPKKTRAEQAMPSSEPTPVTSVVPKAKQTDVRTSDSGADEESESIPSGKYTLQVGSFPTATEAKPMLDRLRKAGVVAFVRRVDLKEKGKWFRIFIGGFPSIEAAQTAGARYRSENVIQSFIVARMPE